MSPTINPQQFRGSLLRAASYLENHIRALFTPLVSTTPSPRYWRMQLHPNVANRSTSYASRSLAAGFIGLDFDGDVGDLCRTTPAALPQPNKDFWAFAHDMAIGDRVLIIAHHFPFALVTVAGDYNYIREPVPELGVWFRHFRRVEDVRYYGDWVTNAAKWQKITITDTISPLHSLTSASYKLIVSWP